ncbi:MULTISPECIES: hypothetical protein [Actinomycetes]|uniref:hypothetical protein n=1 Tax=Actinomycetes TaxID=1760 RepID=UPI0004BF754F|nr:MULTISPECIES: hypothetical protein [Actinomycetes]
MSEDRRKIDEWWNSLDVAQREQLDEFARKSVVDGLAGYPYWNRALCAELLAWSHLGSEVLEAHSEWLAKLKHRAESRGRVWTRAEFLRTCHISEAGE